MKRAGFCYADFKLKKGEKMTQGWKLKVTMKDYGSCKDDQGIMDTLEAKLSIKFSAQFFWYNGEKPAEFTHDGKGVITSTVFDAKIQNDIPEWWEDIFPGNRDFEVVVKEENGSDEICWQLEHGKCSSCTQNGEELVEQGDEDSMEFNIGGWVGQLYVKADEKPDENGKYHDFLAVIRSGLMLSGYGEYWTPVYVKIPGEAGEENTPDAYTKRRIVEDYVRPYIKEGKKISLSQCDAYDEDEDAYNFDIQDDFLSNDDIESPDALPFQQQFIARAWMLENDFYFGIKPYYYDESDLDNMGDGDFEVEDGCLLSYNGSDPSVSIPSSVTKIGEDAFYRCNSLGSVIIPEGVTKIGRSAFYGCTSLGSVIIPEGVTEIREEAFSGCTSLSSVSIPGSVTKIDFYAFEGCTSLSSVIIPGSVTEIGSSAFKGCTSLSDVSISEGVTKIGYGAFKGCTSLSSVIIPEGVTEIGKWAFSSCTSLASVSIPGSVTEIDFDAFEGCTSLTEINHGGTMKQWNAVEKV